MTAFSDSTDSFSLVEVTLALGVAAFCLIAVFGLLPIGLKTNQNAISQTASASIIAAVVADMRATPRATATSTQFGITFGTAKTLFFDGEGRFATSPAANSRYQLNVNFPPNSAGSNAATFAYLKVTWPASAVSGNALGSSEVFAAFDRH